MKSVFEKSQWIWLDHEMVNQYARFAVSFDALGGPGKLYISVDTDYAAFLNGQLVDFNQYDDYPMNKSFDTLPLKLEKGTNHLEVWAWHQGGKGSYSYIPGPAGLLFDVQDEDGKSICVSDEKVLCAPISQYRMGEMECISGQLGVTFHYDASQADAPLAPASIVTARANTTLYPRPNKKLELKAPIAAREVRSGHYAWQGGNTAAEKMRYATLDGETQDGQYVIYDLGREEAGLLRLDVTGDAGTVLYIGWGEQIEQGRVLTYIGGRHFAATYTLKAGENHFTHYFRRLGGRYLQVMTSGGAVNIHRCTVMPTEYPIQCVSDFTCQDDVLQKIYDTSVRTLHLCMHEHYEDTPWREQALYAMDSRNQALCGYCCFGESVYPANYLKLFQEGIRPDHIFDICAPARDRITIPSFALSWVLAVRDHLLYTGDMETARTLYPTVCQVVDGFLDRVDEQTGLTVMPPEKQYWNFYEWTDGMDGKIYGERSEEVCEPTVDAALNLYLILALEAAGQLSRWLKMEREAAFDARREELKARVLDAFYDGEAGAFMTHPGQKHYSEFNQSLALLAHLLPEQAEKNLRARLAQKENGLVPISLSCMLMKYEALIQEKQYHAGVIASIRETWGAMLEAGATSFWEVEEGCRAWDWAGSMCHGWSAVPVYILTVLLLGVVPLEPGFATYAFEPVDKSASGCMKTPFGDIRVANGELVKD